MVTWGNQMIDLNELCRHNNLVISPNRPIATTVAKWEPLALPDSSGYLLADNSVHPFSATTGVISMTATVFKQRAYLTLNTAQANALFT